MKTTFSTPGLIGLALVAALTLALVSVEVERVGPELLEYGNLCGAAHIDPCYEPALKGGFPFAYLFDAPGISVQHQLTFVEDDMHGWPFSADVAVYFAALLLVVLFIARRRPVGTPAGE
jgi:hypothetical protein